MNINPESILIHTTHTHSGAGDGNRGNSMIDRMQLVELLIKAAEIKIIRKALEAEYKAYLNPYKGTCFGNVKIETMS